MRLLVLGGTAFAGRAVVAEALARGWSVTVLNRGVTGVPPTGVLTLHGDRTRPDGLRALAGGRWDVVVDTWRESAQAVRGSAALLAGAAGRYCFVSSLAAYAWPPPPGFGEDAPLARTHDLGPDDEFGAYAADKVLAETAVLEHFGERALVARVGLVLGAHEYAGRLPWWLLRAHRGGPWPVPEPATAVVQYVDAADLAGWLLDGAVRGTHGSFNVVCPAGHATMGSLVAACVDATGGAARPVWIDPRVFLDAGVRPWSQLPIWLPTGHPLARSYEVDVTRATGAGLRPRPLTGTVAATWAWLRRLDRSQQCRQAGQHKPWLTAEQERQLLRAAGYHSG
jgi:nucleoside-diphosphate-sugar epimerase